MMIDLAITTEWNIEIQHITACYIVMCNHASIIVSDLWISKRFKLNIILHVHVVIMNLFECKLPHF